jgi:uncharacterized membrane protein
MTGLIAAAAAFVLLHLIVSGTRVRDTLTGAMGARAYMGLFSLASVGLLVWLGIGYAHARGSAADTAYWTATPATKDIQLAIQLLATLFVVPGLTTPNPTSVGQEKALEKPDLVRGVLRITRHPFLWGVAIWAAGHLLVNGDVASLILFGSLLALALFGPASIDAKRKRALGERWNAFAATTSNVPFSAILAHRQSLKIGEIGWWRLGLALAAWAALIFVHPYAFGASPLN